ncbi:MAG: hypothetical protein LUF04_10645 [Bacteroides sp.]|nr:hypothetical protein [Bacteroides sp.]
MRQHIFICFCLVGGFLSAQTPEELQKEMDQMLSGFQEEMHLFTEEIRADFHRFAEEQDKAFSDMLEQHWKEFSVFSGELRESVPKPVTPPQATPDEQRPSSTVPLAVTPVVPDPVAPSNHPRIPRSPEASADTQPVVFSFYGSTLNISVDRKLAFPYQEEMQERGVAGYWRAKAETSYDSLLDQLFTLKERYGLNDWGFYRLVQSMASQLYGQDLTSARLLTWFLMNKAGYSARLAFTSSNEPVILLSFVQKIYEHPYIEKNGVRYYALQPIPGGIRTYDGEFSEGNRKLDMNLSTALHFADAPVGERRVSFSFNGKDHDVSLRYNQGVIDFYNDYPSTDMQVYFDASVSSELKTDLYTSFIPLLESCSTGEEKVQLLLDFIYAGFPYMTDEEQFGRERYFFVEECFAYPYTDCEDRAVLLSYMVHSLLGYPTIGLLYPGHASTGVCIEGFNKEAYTYIYQGRQYVSCDPTYVNSLVGMAMARYATSKAELIPVKNADLQLERKWSLWEVLQPKGMYPGAAKDNLIAAPDGSYYVCGYFNRSVTCAGQTHHPVAGASPFIGRVDPNGSFDWFIPLRSQQDILQLALFGGEDRLYLTGTALSDLQLADVRLPEKESSQVFLAALSSRGTVDWLNGMKPEEKACNAYTYTLDRDGRIIDKLEFPQTAEMPPVRLTSLDNGNLLLSGILPGSDHLAVAHAQVTHAAEELSVADLLHQLNNQWISNRTDPSIAGVFAFIEMMSKPGRRINGADVIAALDRYNPSFRQRCPNIYKNIATISIVVNESGVMTIQTSHGKSVSFDKVRVQSGSKVSLRTLPSGDIRMDIIDGVKVGAAVIWFRLNHVILYKQNGDLLFDYDKNHTTKTFNLGKDILN